MGPPLWPDWGPPPAVSWTVSLLGQGWALETKMLAEQHYAECSRASECQGMYAAPLQGHLGPRNAPGLLPLSQVPVCSTQAVSAERV